MNSPIATLPGFPFFYAIPIDGQIREIPSQPQIWTEELEEDLKEEDNNTVLLDPPPYSKPLPSLPSQQMSGALPAVQEIDETFNTSTISFPMLAPDDDMITPATGRARTEPVITKSKTLKKKIRYPSLPIGRWAQPSRTEDSPKEVNDFVKTAPQTSEIIHKRKLRFPSLSGRSSWASFRPAVASPLSATAAASASTVSVDLPWILEMPPSLDAIKSVSPISPFSELDSTPVSELSSEPSSPQPSPQLPSQPSLEQIRHKRHHSTPDYSFPIYLPERSPYQSWYIDDDSGELSTLPNNPASHSLSTTDLPPPFSSPRTFLSPPSSNPSSNPSARPSTAPSSTPSTPPPELDYSASEYSRSSRSSLDSFQGDVKESIPDMASLPARPMSILLMTEEEVAQAEIIEDIFLMLHDLQPGYLHPAHRPKGGNFVRASIVRLRERDSTGAEA